MRYASGHSFIRHLHFVGYVCCLRALLKTGKNEDETRSKQQSPQKVRFVGAKLRKAGLSSTNEFC
jgi:hypothetical protein